MCLMTACKRPTHVCNKASVDHIISLEVVLSMVLITVSYVAFSWLKRHASGKEPIATEVKDMTTPGVMRGLRAISICATGAAVLYVLSDGGDLAVVERRVENARENWPSELNAMYVRALEMLPKIDSVSSVTTGSVEQTIESEADTGERPQAKREALQRPETIFCHTCSGPRIWYLTEKLRFKRRISPHSDPPPHD